LVNMTPEGIREWLMRNDFKYIVFTENCLSNWGAQEFYDKVSALTKFPDIDYEFIVVDNSVPPTVHEDGSVTYAIYGGVLKIG